MNKGIKIHLFLPRKCLDKIEKKQKKLEELANILCYEVSYEIYPGVYRGRKVCAILVDFVDSTFMRCEFSYRQFKRILKDITGELPIQVCKMKYQRVSGKDNDMISLDYETEVGESDGQRNNNNN